jgi:hypothetical protein
VFAETDVMAVGLKPVSSTDMLSLAAVPEVEFSEMLNV